MFSQPTGIGKQKRATRWLFLRLQPRVRLGRRIASARGSLWGFDTRTPVAPVAPFVDDPQRSWPAEVLTEASCPSAVQNTRPWP